jgi:hypothetical protein
MQVCYIECSSLTISLVIEVIIAVAIIIVTIILGTHGQGQAAYHQEAVDVH